MGHNTTNSSYKSVDWILLDFVLYLRASVSLLFTVLTIFSLLHASFDELSLVGLALDLVDQPLPFSAVFYDASCSLGSLLRYFGGYPAMGMPRYRWIVVVLLNEMMSRQ